MKKISRLQKSMKNYPACNEFWVHFFLFFRIRKVTSLYYSTWLSKNSVYTVIKHCGASASRAISVKVSTAFLITITRLCDIMRLLYSNFHIIPRINPRLPYQPETPVSAWGPKARGLIRESRADMGVEGWYRVWYENCHIIIPLSYILLWQRPFSLSMQDHVRWF